LDGHVLQEPKSPYLTAVPLRTAASDRGVQG